MLPVILVVQVLLLICVVLLLMRKTAPPVVQDPRLIELPDHFGRLDDHVREAFAQMRNDIPDEAGRTRKENAESAAALRKEVVDNIDTLGTTLTTGLAKFGEDNTTSADKLRNDVEQKMHTMSQSFSDFKTETNLKHSALQETLNTKLIELMASNTTHQDRLRGSVETSLTNLTTSNETKLEQMRITVDEKLQKTLESRLTASFGQVTTHLGEVQKGLGEMKELATGVGDLKKVLSNVSRRGGVGQLFVGQQLEQMFSREQYFEQHPIKPASREVVDFALKFPNGDPGSFVLLPIDTKFPTEDRERLEQAYESGTADDIAAATKAFARAIRVQAKSIADKYIDPPTTMPIGIMALPTENLYAEVVRCPGLQEELQQKFGITVAGPSTFMALLTAFQLGFHTLAIQKKGDEVWRVLGKAKAEFGNFGTLMDKVEKQVGTVQNTIRDINSKTTTINRALKDVSSFDNGSPASNLIGFSEIPGALPLIAAGGEEE